MGKFCGSKREGKKSKCPVHKEGLKWERGRVVGLSSGGKPGRRPRPQERGEGLSKRGGSLVRTGTVQTEIAQTIFHQRRKRKNKRLAHEK